MATSGIIESARQSNEYGKALPPLGSVLSNLLTMPLRSGLGDKKAHLDYGFPYLFGGLATSNNQGGLFILAQIAEPVERSKRSTGPKHQRKDLL